MNNNLTILANAKAWLNVTTTTDDALINRLISSASRFIMSYIERPSLFKAQYADVFDAIGQNTQMLSNWPVLSVSNVIVGSQVIPASPGIGQSGFSFDAWNGLPPGSQQRLYLNGYCFGRGGPGAVSVTYTAGFVVQNEAQSVPASPGPYTVTVNAPYGNWAVDAGVTYANGTALKLVTGTPTIGQYSVAAGVYTFSAADANAAVLISYSFIPADIEDACIEMVGERYSYKNRIGYVSKSLAGQETVTFSQKTMPDYVKSALQPYKSYIPV